MVHHGRSRALALPAIAVLALCVGAQGATISILAGSNCSIDSQSGVYNAVTSTGLQIWRFSSSNRQTDMEFDLSALPAGATINSATVRVTTTGTIGANTATPPAFATFNFFSTPGDGISASTDHTDFDPGTFQTSVSYPLGAGGPPTNTVLDYAMSDLTDFQNAAVSSPSSWIAIHISTPDLVSWHLHALLSSTPGIVKPTLIIDYTPVPAPATVAPLALVACVTRRRRA